MELFSFTLFHFCRENWNNFLLHTKMHPNVNRQCKRVSKSCFFLIEDAICIQICLLSNMDNNFHAYVRIWQVATYLWIFLYVSKLWYFTWLNQTKRKYISNDCNYILFASMNTCFQCPCTIQYFYNKDSLNDIPSFEMIF